MGKVLVRDKLITENDGFDDFVGFKAEPFGAYAAHRAINHSLLGKIDPLRSGAPALALAELLGLMPRRDSDAMTWGSAVHSACLEPDDFERDYVAAGRCTATKGDGSQCKNDGKRLHVNKGWLCGVHGRADAGNNAMWMDGLLVLSQADYDGCIRARDQVLVHHEVAREILAPVGVEMDREITGVWNDDETEYRCKLRGDNVDDASATLTDIKTTRDASPASFQRRLWEYAIYRQLGWYDSGFETLQRPMQSHVIIAVERTYPNLVAVYRLPEYLVAMGSREAQALKRRLVECDERDDWPGFTDGIVELSLNKWDMNKLVDLYGDLEEA